MNRIELARIGKLAREFTDLFPSFLTVEGAYNKCKFASIELAKFLQLNGIAAEVIHLQGRRAPYPFAHKKWLKTPDKDWTHYAVRVRGQVVIDCTARQFEPTFSVPLIEASADTQLKWVTVEVDTFVTEWATELATASRRHHEIQDVHGQDQPVRR